MNKRETSGMLNDILQTEKSCSWRFLQEKVFLPTQDNKKPEILMERLESIYLSYN